MENYKEIEGNLITDALSGAFDVITHGCNIWNVMGAGIAPHMAKNFRCNTYDLEQPEFRGDINKLGQIEAHGSWIDDNGIYIMGAPANNQPWPYLTVINSYTQADYNARTKPFDYDAFTLCMRKINHNYKGKHIGLPGLIGCGLAGGDEIIVKAIIKKELIDMRVTIVYLPEMLKSDVTVTTNKHGKTEISGGGTLFGAQG